MQTISAYAGQLSLRIEEYRGHGQKEATKHRPATNAAHPDNHEITLKSQAESLIANEQLLFDTSITEAMRVAHEATGKVIELRSEIDQALTDDTLDSQVEADLSNDRNSLVQATASRITAEVEWRGFRAANSITDSPRYPESQIWHWSLIVAFVFIETLVNAFFYQNNNGLIGGFIVAAAVASVNMGSAAILGTLFRRKNLADPVQKYFGWACLPIFFLLTVFCNALFSAFRSAYESVIDPSDTGEMAVAFRSAWEEAAGIFVFDFHFGDFSSFLLFMSGIILSGIAFWKGYTSDDPYPGYSDRDRRLKAAKMNEEQAQERIKQKLKDSLFSHRSRVQGLAAQPGTQIALLSRRIADVSHAQQGLVSRAEAIERDHHLVLDSYRHANLAVRGTEPPEYFARKPDLAAKINANSAENAHVELRQALAEVETLQGTYRDALNEKLKLLQERASQILSDTYEKFVEAVRKEAQQLVQQDIQIMPAQK